jgi:hypothetical protein
VVKLIRVALLGSALVLALGGTASGKRQGSPIAWSLQGYSNNVKVRPPLIAAYQLGKVFIHGSGGISSDGSLSGQIVVRTVPLTESIPARSLVLKTVGYSFYKAAHGAYSKLDLSVEITSSRAPGECAPGTRGILTLYDSQQALSNGQRSDYITLTHWSGHCATFVMGFTNEDAGDRTSPRYGGPPHGGQWAVVHVSAPLVH